MASREPKLRPGAASDEESEEATARRLRSVRMIGPLRRLIKQIHLAGTERDRAGNRQFFYDHYLSLLLLCQRRRIRGTPGAVGEGPATQANPVNLPPAVHPRDRGVRCCAHASASSAPTNSCRSTLLSAILQPPFTSTIKSRAEHYCLEDALGGLFGGLSVVRLRFRKPIMVGLFGDGFFAPPWTFAKFAIAVFAMMAFLNPGTCLVADNAVSLTSPTFVTSDNSPWKALADPAVERTYCEYLPNPVGIDTPKPRLSWVLESDRRGVLQQAYQILVASSPEKLAADSGDLWNSGEVRSNESVNIDYQGEKLSSRQQCWWKVRVWDDRGQVSPWSKPATFEMALLELSNWHGHWIGLGGEKSAAISPLLRKEFVVRGPVKRATIYASGLGWSEYYLNGKRIGDRVLDPATADYDKRILYVTHDVTSLVHAGPNVLGTMLGNGWYSQYGKGYGDSPRLLFEMVLELADGTQQQIASDETWKASTGPILENSIWGGELYDAQLEKAGWLQPGYDDSSWTSAAPKSNPGGRLEAQMIEPIKVNKVLRPLQLTNPKPGVYVYDFGQLFAGWVKLRVKGPAGTKVAMRYSARVFPDGDLADLDDSIDRDARAGHATRVVPISGLVDKRHHKGPDGASDFYTLKGDPAGECYEPRFTFHPVRYVQIEGFPGTPALSDVEGCVVHSAVDMSGDFQCSNPLLNQIYSNCAWTITNSMYGITMDCIYREYWGWLEPSSNPSALFARKFTPRFWTKFLRDAQYAQHPDGVIPDVIPNYPPKGRKTGDPAWAGNYPLVVWYAYQYFDDRQLLEAHYSSMKRWVDYLTSISKNHLIEGGGYYGDHMLSGDAPGEEEFVSKETPPALLWTAFYYKSVSIMAESARILGANDDAATYGQLADAIRTAFNEKWLHPSGKNYATGSQTSNISALAFGLVPESDRQGVLNSLVNDILVKRQGHLHTGNIGTTCIMDALPALGGSDALYRVATATDYPGWGYMARQGATTVWESWGGVQEGFVGYNTSEDSMPMLASIQEFFYNDLAGIQGPDYFGTRTMTPGFRKICIRPNAPGDLTGASAHIRTVRGIVGVGWKRGDNRVTLKATIPVNAQAKISIPKIGLRNITIKEGDRLLWEKGAYLEGISGISVGAEDPEYVTFDTGSGTYIFTLLGVP